MCRWCERHSQLGTTFTSLEAALHNKTIFKHTPRCKITNLISVARAAMSDPVAVESTLPN